MSNRYTKLLRKSLNERIEDTEDAIAKLEQKMKKEGFRCKRCGKCCRATGHVDICLVDAKKWEKHGRKDLLSDEMLLEWDAFGSSELFGEGASTRCPFLKKVRNKKEYYCELQDIKPLFCRYFPNNKKHAKEFCDCPGYD